VGSFILLKIPIAIEKDYEVVSSELSNEYGLARLSRQILSPGVPGAHAAQWPRLGFVPPE
jgi:hypothetical protein